VLDSKFFISVILIASHCVVSNSAYADGGNSRRDPQRGEDSRLPPVLPGEVVTTDNGDQIKVWSSVGPVPVSSPPSAPALPGSSGGVGQLGGVIVDSRSLLNGEPVSRSAQADANK
jgi:hypothetical protein